ncbi:MAG: hypothetical protein SF182_06650 [Deltaproteobacteria bacterium]|nr:hypothetical protein [Deltaproteobacteria bacterium]
MTAIPRSLHRLARATALVGVVACASSPTNAQDPFADAVTSFTAGSNGGFNSGALPQIVLGPPQGAGLTQGSTDVLALGSGGSIVLRFDLPVVCDGPGADLTIFENAFHSGSPSGPLFTEYAFVELSQDGVSFIPVAHDTTTHAGLAGQTPVLSSTDNGIDPLDPTVSGGDHFDLASVGLAWARYVRITDVAGAIPDVGDLPQFSIAPNAGFDLDAAAALHACDPGALPSPTPSATASFTATATPSSPADATATATASSTPSATATRTAAMHDVAALGRKPLRIDLRTGAATASKRLRVAVRNADASGELPIRLVANACQAVVGIAVDFDRRLVGDQDTGLVRAGRSRSALLTVTVAAAAIDTPDRNVPASCPLTITAVAQPPGGIDPRPLDNSAVIDLRLLDRGDFR